MGIQRVDLHDEDVEIGLCEEVVIVADGISCWGLMVDVVEVLFGFKTGLPLGASLGCGSAVNEVGADHVAGGFAFTAIGFRGAEIGVLCSLVGLTSRRARNVLLLEVVALRQRVGGREGGGRG